MRENKFVYFGASEVKPEGWLRERLLAQAKGLSGNLDLVWPDIRDSKWIGGDRDGWERMPYWLDGFIPLAWLLQDKELQGRANRYMDAILGRQQEDGWICPCSLKERDRYDVWVAFLICKVLVVYHDCTGDVRIEDAVHKALRSLYEHLEKHTLFDWGAARWFECLIPLFWLYERRPEEWLLDLAQTLKIEGFDYGELFGRWRFEKPKRRWNYKTHVVNLAMALKAEALYSKVTGEGGGKLGRLAHGLLLRDHGMASGHFTGDECISGTSPVQGSELCSVVEAMYSYEWLFAVTGDLFWADQLEQLAFNALPAAMSPDMWTHQYDQMTNQPQCLRIPEEKVHFRTNNGEAHLFGLEPHFGCCTANFSQGWPKFALSVFARDKDGIVIGAIAPATLSTEMDGIKVECKIDTAYPFGDEVRIRVRCERAVQFALSVRIPGCAKRAVVNGEVCEPGLHRIEKVWQGEETIVFGLEFTVEWVRSGQGLYAVKRGALVFALPVKEEWRKLEYEKDGVKRCFPYCDYEVLPKSRWAYAFAGQEAEVVQKKGNGSGKKGASVFHPEHAPVCLKVRCYPIQWESEYGICAEVPSDATPVGEAEELELIPYGCTNLRMTQLPMAERNLSRFVCE